MAPGIVRAADRVAIWHQADAESQHQKAVDDLMASTSPPPTGVTPGPPPVAPAPAVVIPKSNKFAPAKQLKKLLDETIDAPSQTYPEHTHPSVKAFTDKYPGFAQTYLKPQYQDALKASLGEKNYDKLLYHMPAEHHQALTQHAQKPAPKSKKFTTPTNQLKKLLDNPNTTPEHVQAFIDKNPGYAKTYLDNPSYQSALKGHLGEKAYEDWQEHLTPSTKPAKSTTEQNILDAFTGPGKPWKQMSEEQFFGPGGPASPAGGPKPAQPKNLQQQLSEATGHQWGEGWADASAEMNKQGLENNIKDPGSNWTPEQVAGMKKVYEDNYGQFPEPGFGDKVKAAIPTVNGALVDLFNKKTPEQAQDFINTLANPGEFQKVYDEHYGKEPTDQDDIEAIKGQMPSAEPWTPIDVKGDWQKGQAAPLLKDLGVLGMSQNYLEGLTPAQAQAKLQTSIQNLNTGYGGGAPHPNDAEFAKKLQVIHDKHFGQSVPTGGDVPAQPQSDAEFAKMIKADPGFMSWAQSVSDDPEHSEHGQTLGNLWQKWKALQLPPAAAGGDVPAQPKPEDLAFQTWWGQTNGLTEEQAKQEWAKVGPQGVANWSPGSANYEKYGPGGTAAPTPAAPPSANEEAEKHQVLTDAIKSIFPNNAIDFGNSSVEELKHHLENFKTHLKGTPGLEKHVQQIEDLYEQHFGEGAMAPQQPAPSAPQAQQPAPSGDIPAHQDDYGDWHHDESKLPPGFKNWATDSGVPLENYSPDELKAALQGGWANMSPERQAQYAKGEQQPAPSHEQDLADYEFPVKTYNTYMKDPQFKAWLESLSPEQLKKYEYVPGSANPFGHTWEDFQKAKQYDADDIAALKQQMGMESAPSGQPGQPITDAIKEVYPSWGAADWFAQQTPPKQKEVMESWIKGNPDSPMKAVYDKYFGQEPAPSAPHIDPSGYLNQDFMKWFEQNNNHTWGAQPGHDKELIDMLKDPNNKWGQTKVKAWVKSVAGTNQDPHLSDWEKELSPPPEQQPSGGMLADLKKAWPEMASAWAESFWGGTPTAEHKAKLESVIQLNPDQPGLKQVYDKYFGQQPAPPGTSDSAFAQHFQTSANDPDILHAKIYDFLGGISGLSQGNKNEIAQSLMDQHPNDLGAYLQKQYPSAYKKWQAEHQQQPVPATAPQQVDVEAIKQDLQDIAGWGPIAVGLKKITGTPEQIKAQLQKWIDNGNYPGVQKVLDKHFGAGAQPTISGIKQVLIDNGWTPQATGLADLAAMHPDDWKEKLESWASGVGAGPTGAQAAQVALDKFYGAPAGGGPAPFDAAAIAQGLAAADPDYYDDDLVEEIAGQTKKWHKTNLEALIKQVESGELGTPDQLVKYKALYQKYFGGGAGPGGAVSPSPGVPPVAWMKDQLPGVNFDIANKGITGDEITQQQLNDWAAENPQSWVMDKWSQEPDPDKYLAQTGTPAGGDAYAYPGASFAGVGQDFIDSLPTGLYYDGGNKAPGGKLSPGAAAFLESQGYGPQELKALPYNSVGGEPSQVGLMQAWLDLDQEAKVQFAAQEQSGGGGAPAGAKPFDFSTTPTVEQLQEAGLSPQAAANFAKLSPGEFRSYYDKSKNGQIDNENWEKVVDWVDQQDEDGVPPSEDLKKYLDMVEKGGQSGNANWSDKGKALVKTPEFAKWFSQYGDAHDAWNHIGLAINEFKGEHSNWESYLQGAAPATAAPPGYDGPPASWIKKHYPDTGLAKQTDAEIADWWVDHHDSFAGEAWKEDEFGDKAEHQQGVPPAGGIDKSVKPTTDQLQQLGVSPHVSNFISSMSVEDFWANLDAAKASPKSYGPATEWGKIVQWVDQGGGPSGAAPVPLPQFDWSQFGPEFNAVFPGSKWATGSDPGAEPAQQKLKDAIEFANQKFPTSDKTKAANALYEKWFGSVGGGGAAPTPAGGKGISWGGGAAPSPEDQDEISEIKQYQENEEDPGVSAPAKSEQPTAENLTAWSATKPSTPPEWKDFAAWWGKTQLTPEQEQGIYQSWFPGKQVTPEFATGWMKNVYDHHSKPSTGDLAAQGMPAWATTSWALGDKAQAEWPVFQTWANNDAGIPQGTGIKQKLAIWKGLSAADKKEIAENYMPATPIDTKAVVGELQQAFPDSDFSKWAAMPQGTLKTNVELLAKSGYNEAIPVFNNYFGGKIPMPQAVEKKAPEAAPAPALKIVPPSKVPDWVKSQWGSNGTVGEAEAKDYTELKHFADSIGVDVTGSTYPYPLIKQWNAIPKYLQNQISSMPQLPWTDKAGLDAWVEAQPKIIDQLAALKPEMDWGNTGYGTAAWAFTKPMTGSYARAMRNKVGGWIEEETDPQKKQQLLDVYHHYFGNGKTTLAQSLSAIYPNEDWDKKLKSAPTPKVMSELKKRLKTEKDPEKWAQLVDVWAKYFPHPDNPSKVAPTGITQLTKGLKYVNPGDAMPADDLKALKYWKHMGNPGADVLNNWHADVKAYDDGPYIQSKKASKDKGGYPAYHGWTPPGSAAGETFKADPAMLGSSGPAYTVPQAAQPQQDTKDYTTLMEVAKQHKADSPLKRNADGTVTSAGLSKKDLDVMRSEEFKNWWVGASRGYRNAYQHHPSVALEDFQNFMQGGDLYGQVPGGEDKFTGGDKYLDVSPYGAVPKPGSPATKSVPGAGGQKSPGVPSFLQHIKEKSKQIKFPRREPSPGQETLPLAPGEHLAPDYAPLPIYRLMRLKLNEEPHAPDWVKGSKARELHVQQQKARLRRIDEIVNGKEAARKHQTDDAEFKTFAARHNLDEQAKDDLELELFSPKQGDLFSNDKWKYFEDFAKQHSIEPKEMFDLAQKMEVSPPPESKGNYEHPELAQLILDYLENGGGAGASGVGTHWTRDYEKAQLGFKQSGIFGPEKMKSTYRQIPLLMYGLWGGQGETETPEGQAFSPTDPTEMEQNLQANAPIFIHRMQLRGQEAGGAAEPWGKNRDDWHDVMDHIPLSMIPPGPNETASTTHGGYGTPERLILDKPSLAQTLQQGLGGGAEKPETSWQFAKQDWDHLTPGHRADMMFNELVGKLGPHPEQTHPDELARIRKIYQMFFVGRPDMPVKPHRRRASLDTDTAEQLLILRMARFADDEYAQHTQALDDTLEDHFARQQDSRHLHGIIGADDKTHWSPSRLRAQRKAVDRAWAELNGDDVPQQGKAMLLGGLAGSGKGSLYNHPDLGLHDYLPIDPDFMKQIMAKEGMIPDIEGYSPMESSPLVHHEASELATRLAERAYRQGRNVVWDTTMGNERATNDTINRLRQSGYHTVDAAFMKTNPQIARRRSEQRHRADEEAFRDGVGQGGMGGRWVPHGVSRWQTSSPGSGAGSRPESVFNNIRSKVDNTAEFNGDTTPATLVRKNGPVWGGTDFTPPPLTATAAVQLHSVRALLESYEHAELSFDQLVAALAAADYTERPHGRDLGEHYHHAAEHPDDNDFFWVDSAHDRDVINDEQRQQILDAIDAHHGGGDQLAQIEARIERLAAVPQKIYRGITVPHGSWPKSLEGDGILDALAGGQSEDPEASLGRHWTTSRRVAEESTGQHGTQVILESTHPGEEHMDPEFTNVGWIGGKGTWPQEREITLKPGAPLAINSVQVRHPQTGEWQERLQPGWRGVEHEAALENEIRILEMADDH